LNDGTNNQQTNDRTIAQQNEQRKEDRKKERQNNYHHFRAENFPKRKITPLFEQIIADAYSPLLF
jgi:hypothetical protein